ncbi:MAG: glycosyltransferase [Clostridiales bacterium]|jgi:glycosyltransferase involved in cell wall biosynthesis|nr:glycosyltransferase [Clostridiales bacterium]
MKITIVADVLGNGNNGTSVTANRLIDSLRKRGHEVRVVATSYEGLAEFYRVDKRSFPFLNGYIEKNGVSLAKPDKNLLKKVIQDSDVVHVMMPFKLGQTAVKTAKQLEVPCTAAFHCQPENFTTHLKMREFGLLNDYLYSRFRRVLYRHVQGIHCPSRFIETELKNRGYKSRMHVISNGVPDRFVPDKREKPEAYRDKFCILYTGRMSGEKRHDVLIKAIKRSKYKDKIQLILAGNGPKQPKIERLCQKYGIPLDIGLRDQDTLYNIINYCDLYAHPGDVELESLACLEAISCGLVPVISDSKKSATKQFALTEHNLFKKGSSRSLAARIDHYIEHEAERLALSERYAEFADNFRIDRCMDEMEKMFLSVAKEH